MTTSLIPETINTAMLAGAAADFVIPVVDSSGATVDLSTAIVSVGLSINEVSAPLEYLPNVVSGNVITVEITPAKSNENSGRCRFLSVWVTITGNPRPVARMWIDFKRSTRG